MPATILLLAVGFVSLIKGADLLVKGASSIARRFNISDLVIGLTVVAFGTSAPELAVNIIASMQGNTGMAIGNILGSNIANVLLILGTASIICPLAVSSGTVWKEIPFSLLAALVLGFLVNDRFLDQASASIISRSDGLVLLCFFAIFLYYSASIARKVKGQDEILPALPLPLPRALLLTGSGMAGLTLGGMWIVGSASKIGVALGMSDSMVGLTIVAVGTSLPELATSAMAAYRRNVDIAVGNVVGSNIFNIFLVLGVSSTIRPLPFTADNIDVAVMIFSNLALFATMFTRKKRSLDKEEGYFLLACYVAYMIYVVWRG
jgi:cation:H+ antiporter